MTQRTPVLSLPERGRLPRFAAFAATRTAEPAHDFDAAELAALGGKAVPARRHAYRLGRAAAHAALRDLGRDGGPILRGPGRAPCWPAGVAGSISHAAGIGVALAAHREYTDGVGIDVEARRPAPELAGQVPGPEEQAWLAAAPPAERDDLLLALFSAKESVFKAFYPRVGAIFGFEAASLRPTPGGFAARLVAPLDSDYPATREFPVWCGWQGELVTTWLILPGAAERR